MAYAITRVELHGASTPAEYQTLHMAMEQRGFRRYYDSGGRRYFLPEAEYIRYNTPARDCLTLAQSAVAETSKSASIIVTVAAEFAQSGLRASTP